jgi:hypothetical protein
VRRRLRDRLSVDLDARNVDDVLQRVAEGLLIVCEDAFIRLLNLPIVFFQGQLNHHGRFAEEFTSHLDVLLIVIVGNAISL